MQVSEQAFPVDGISKTKVVMIREIRYFNKSGRLVSNWGRGAWRLHGVLTVFSALVAEREGFVLGVLESGVVVRLFVAPGFGERGEDGGIIWRNG